MDWVFSSFMYMYMLLPAWVFPGIIVWDFTPTSQHETSFLLILASMKWVVSVPSSLLFRLPPCLPVLSQSTLLSHLFFTCFLLYPNLTSVIFIQDQCFSCHYLHVACMPSCSSVQHMFFFFL